MNADDTARTQFEQLIHQITAPSPSSSSTINPDTNSILDSDPILPNDLALGDVVINVPYLCINADEVNGRDEAIMPNLRAINYDKLFDLMNVAVKIPDATNEQQIDLYHQFINIIIQTSAQSVDDISHIMNFLKFAAQLGKDIDVNDNYSDINTNGISFDIIRKYVTDQTTGILLSANPIVHDSTIQLYSQLSNEQNVLNIRKLYNDTDFNRIQYYLTCFEKTLMFRPGFVYSRTVKVTNLALFYLCLLNHSRPIDKLCSNDLKANFLGYIIDAILRSRVIQAWQKEASSKKLLSDLVKNYDKNNHILNLCQLNSAKMRAQYFLNQLSKKPELSEYINHINYKSYETLIDKFKQVIDGKEYYMLGSQFITDAATMPDIKMFSKIYESQTGK